jgi:hypothetical protein
MFARLAENNILTPKANLLKKSNILAFLKASKTRLKNSSKKEKKKPRKKATRQLKKCL